MIIIIHVIVALLSTAQAVLLYARPSKRNFTIQYYLITATIGSGTVLILAAGASMLRSCMVGLAYLVIVTAGLVLARRRKALFVTENHDHGS